MCDFKIGDEVVCVDASSSDEGVPCPLIQGGIYTVASLPEVFGELGVLVEEVAPPPPYMEFRPSRFRKRRDLNAWLETGGSVEEPRREPAAPAKRERA